MAGYASISEAVQDYMEVVRHLAAYGEQRTPEEEAAGGVWFRQTMEQIKEKEQQTDIFLPLPYLRKCYSLDETLVWLVAFSLALELDNGICPPLPGSNSRAVPDFQYGLRLISGVYPVPMDIAARLCDRGNPIWEIFLPETAYAASGMPAERQYILRQPMLLRRQAVCFLCTGSILAQGSAFRYLYPGAPMEGNIYIREYDRISRCFSVGRALRILLYGRNGSGKKQLLAGLCDKHGMQGLLIDAACLFRMGDWEKEDVFRTIRFCSIVSLSPVIIEWNGRDEEKEEAVWLGHMLERFLGDRLVFLLSEEEAACRRLLPRMDMMFRMKEYLSAAEKSSLLESHIPKEHRLSWQDELLARYQFQAGELTEKLWKITVRTGLDEGKTKPDLIWKEILREEFAAGHLGELVETRETLEDFAGSEENKNKLRTVIRLAADWQKNTGRLREAGLYFPENLLLLFHGPSGTGKTMSASILSRELGIPMRKVNLSGIFDKYIGETEKHLDEIFHTAQRHNQILFFDEADALFSKRTRVEDSHDKYANISTSYLLQRIESYRGIIVLATNLIHQFDDAFLRRIRFVIKFTPLDLESRTELWKKTLHGPLLLSKDVRPQRLAQAAAFSAARIKSAAQIACMLALQEGSGILTYGHLEAAIRMEAEKDEMRVKNVLEAQEPDCIFL